MEERPTPTSGRNADAPYEPVTLAADAVREAAALFTEASLFVHRELGRMPLVACYQLRSSGHVVCCRHGTHDIEVIHELFVRDAYRIPAPVRQRLLSLDRAIDVADLGANIGAFSIFVQTVLAVRGLVSIEPDRWNFEVLRVCAAKNMALDKWRVVHAAAATSAGSVHFLSGRFASSRVASDPRSAGATRVPAIDAFPVIEEADLVKIDVEGSEWDLMADVRFSTLRATAIVLEYHDVFCPDTAPDRTATRLLEGAGFEASLPFNNNATRGMIWGWRPA